jgi:nitrate/nitrite-specific signal transduction histidine kinase
VDTFSLPNQKKARSAQYSEQWLYGIATAGLTAISNLVLFLLLFKDLRILGIAAGAVLFAGVFLSARKPQQQNRLYLSAFIINLAWSGYFITHEVFWAGVFWFIIPGLWLISAIIFFGLPTGIKRLIAFIPSLFATFVVVILELSPVLERLDISDFSINRYIAPLYFFIFGVYLFLIILRDLHTRQLSTKMISSMVMIVFIPIAVLTMVTYSNTKLNDTLAAASSLDQVASQKSGDIQEWSASHTRDLASLLETNSTFLYISDLLNSSASGDIVTVYADRQALDPILVEVADRYGFEEILLMDVDGKVITSTRSDLLGQDYRYAEFFWQGKAGEVTITPRYYPQENEVSIFFSRPVRNYSGEILGVLSGRARIDGMINLVTAPVTQPYSSTLAYLVNTDGTLLAKSDGRPTTFLETAGAQILLSTNQNGYSSYNNIEGLPVIGVYHWLPDLKVGVIVEASQSEVYQRLPRIIASNIAIGILAFFLAAVAAISIVRSITNPINELVNASQNVVQGNLDTQVQTNREDELGILTDAYNKMTSELKLLVTGLETRVSERTRDLEKRSLELQTAAQIAKDASLASNMNDLLSRTTRLIRERFGFYHVGVFLNDDKNEYTLLRAAGGDAGQVMLANGHKLKIGETGIVGAVSKTGEPRIALDVGADSVYFRNPLLPYTRSEMALPLKVGANTIGVLDVQSDKVNAFDQNDITIMSILTDQLAIAIERTRLLQESDESTKAMELALQSQSSREWHEYLSHSQQSKAYRYAGVQVEAMDGFDARLIKSIPGEESVFVSQDPGSSGCTASIPIRLRGQVLGAIKLQFTTPHISSDTRRVLEESASRLSLALENARLVQDSQRLASQEKQINNISSQIQQSTNLETILQNTIKELGKTLGVPKTFIQIGLESSKNTDNE